MKYKWGNIFKAIRTVSGNNKPNEKYLLSKNIPLVCVYVSDNSLVEKLSRNFTTENKSTKLLTSVVIL